MLELFIHRFDDCADFPAQFGSKLRHKLTTHDIRRVTCTGCKERIVALIVKRSWAQLTADEERVLDIVAIEIGEILFDVSVKPDT